MNITQFNRLAREQEFYTSKEYYDIKTYNPFDHLRVVTKWCLRTPFTDWFLYIFIICSLFTFTVKEGQRKKLSVRRSEAKLEDFLKLMKDNYKNFLFFGVASYILIKIMNF